MQSIEGFFIVVLSIVMLHVIMPSVDAPLFARTNTLAYCYNRNRKEALEPKFNYFFVERCEDSLLSLRDNSPLGRNDETFMAF
jgi:hypothetical protein